ncbi:MAG: hypothetical protein HQK51_21775 [Oligoflexia bacterium]|nr:hypothetical protein [Oligoflexia bacterium]
MTTKNRIWNLLAERLITFEIKDNKIINATVKLNINLSEKDTKTKEKNGSSPICEGSTIQIIGRDTFPLDNAEFIITDSEEGDSIYNISLTGDYSSASMHSYEKFLPNCSIVPIQREQLKRVNDSYSYGMSGAKETPFKINEKIKLPAVKLSDGGQSVFWFNNIKSAAGLPNLIPESQSVNFSLETTAKLTKPKPKKFAWVGTVSFNKHEIYNNQETTERTGSWPCTSQVITTRNWGYNGNISIPKKIGVNASGVVNQFETFLGERYDKGKTICGNGGSRPWNVNDIVQTSRTGTLNINGPAENFIAVSDDSNDTYKIKLNIIAISGIEEAGRNYYFSGACDVPINEVTAMTPVRELNFYPINDSTSPVKAVINDHGTKKLEGTYKDPDSTLTINYSLEYMEIDND